MEKESDKESDEKSTLENEETDTIDMPDLQTEEYIAERRNQKGKGLEIVTSNQMLSRLPISLAQLKARNKSIKLKNGIRQLLHSFRRSKKLAKQLYKSLLDII